MIWNTFKFSAAVALACVVTASAGEAAEPEEKPPLVKEIDLTGLGAVLKRLDAAPLHNNPRGGPTLLTSFEQLAQAVPDKEWQVKINALVDFDAQQVLYFWWRGLPGDKLSYRVVEGKTEPVVAFRYTRGPVVFHTVQHTRLFVLAKKVNFKVEHDEKAPLTEAVVREIDLKQFKVKWPVGSVYKPTEIRNAEELDKFNFDADKDWLAQLVKQVDFARERLVFMAWSGSGGDALTVTVEEGKKGPLVFFEYVVGNSDDKATHYRLFGVANNASWRVDDVGKRPSAEPAGPSKDDSTAKLLKDLESENPFHRGIAIDLLGERKAKEAIPKLIALVSDGTALVGSDNYVGLHAMQALAKITGQKFDLDQKKWQAWWKEQQKEAAQPAIGSDSSVKVVSAEATVELRGLLVHTPKGTFVMVREERKVRSKFGFDGDETEVEVVAWELDFGKKAAELEPQAKGLSGKAVVVNGSCKMVPALTYGGNPINPSLPSGSEWRLEKVVTVSRLAAPEKK